MRGDTLGEETRDLGEAREREVTREDVATSRELVEFIRELAEDAARYQWLRSLDGACDAAACVNFNIGFDWIEQHGAELDAAIDQARGKVVAGA